MIPYSRYRPSAFDVAGLNLPDQQGWLVFDTTTRTRDSGIMEESNFHAALTILGGESDTVEVHRFNHWVCGWLELILLAPDRQSDGDAIEARLADYPLLDEDDYSQRELNMAAETWTHMTVRDRVAIIQRYGESRRYDGPSCFAARHDTLPSLKELSPLVTY